jgi:hypothetical protein
VLGLSCRIRPCTTTKNEPIFSLLWRENDAARKREERRRNRIEELQLRENEKQRNMLKMLGLDNLKGHKIKIAARKDE